MKNKICIKCTREILKDDDYVHFEEITKGKVKSEGFMHIKCWDDFIDMRKMAYSMIGRTNKLLDMAGLKV